MKTRSFPVKKISLAVLAAASSTAFAADTYTTDINSDITNKSEVIIGASITNNADITGVNLLKFNSNWKTLTNAANRTIDAVHFGKRDVAPTTIKNFGTLITHDAQVDTSIDNSGIFKSHSSSLVMEGHTLTVRSGSSITQQNGALLDLISVTGPHTPVTIEAGSTLAAKKIFIKGTISASCSLAGTLTGDDITIEGGYISSFTETSKIVGKRLHIGQIDQYNGDTGNLNHGGLIRAEESLEFSSYAHFENATIETDVLTFKNNAIDFDGTTTVSANTAYIGQRLSMCGDAKFANNTIDTVIFTAQEAANVGRVQIDGNQPVHINNLIVEKSIYNGSAVSAKLVDKMISSESGVTSFTVDKVQIEPGAVLAVYADKASTIPQTDVTLGSVNILENGKLLFGLRESAFTALNHKTIDRLTLAQDAVVDGGTTDVSRFAEIHSITFAGDNASVTSTLIGDNTSVSIANGSTGASLSDVQTGSLEIFVEDSSAEGALTVESLSNSTRTSVTAGAANNTGNAERDLTAAAASVSLPGSYTKGVQVAQAANEIFDGASATVNADGTISGLTVSANPATHGIAEMTALGVQIWRSEINDMNKRLGELRDSSAESNGVWARVYNGKAKYGAQSVTNKYTSFQFGYDRQIADGVWLGGAFSYTDGNNDFRNGDGDSSLFAFTAYGSWLADNGMFLDVTGKVGRMKNSFDIGTTMGLSSASYHTNTVSMSAEAGWRLYPLANAFFVEPQVEVMYGHVFDADYTTSLGVNVSQDSTDSLIGRAGFALGLKCPNNRGNAYVRASVLHDWKGEASSTFTKNGMTRTLFEDLGDTWIEYGIGANFNATKNLHVYADLEATESAKVETSYRFNLGVRYAW